MTQWLQTILAEISAVTDVQRSYAEPEEECCAHEHVVGIADADMQKVFFLFMQYVRRSREIRAGLPFCGKVEREAQVTDYYRFDCQADALKEIFWTSCRTAFPELCGKSSIGIRKGWKIVWTEHGSLGEGLDILSALLGGGMLDKIFGDRSDEGSRPN